MSINEHLTSFAGKPVVNWLPGMAINDPSGSNYRIGFSFDDYEPSGNWKDRFKKKKTKPTWAGRLASFLALPRSGEVTGLVVGPWNSQMESDVSSKEVVGAIASAHQQLPHLRALFIGDIISEENEISWITQSDLSPLFAAYPNLESFGVRGADSLTFGHMQHNSLKTLIIESGGLPAEVVREIASAQLPELEHLQMWLGTDYYGGNAHVDDLQPILSGQAFPKLKYLGLRDSEIADLLAQALTMAPITERIRELDLSLGNLSDVGATALAASPAVRRLSKLNISHHYCSEEAVQQLLSLDIEVDATDPQTPDNDGDRYIAVSE
jgi:hypothetical protein